MTTTTTNRIESIEVRQLADPDADTSYLYQGDDWKDRREAMERGEFGYVGVDARAIVYVAGVRQEITSGGLWSIESDSDESYFAEIGSEQLDELAGILRELGFSEESVQEARPNA